MKQPELTLEFAPGDSIFPTLGGRYIVTDVDYANEIVKCYRWSVYRAGEYDAEFSMVEALRWYAERDGECIRNPWSRP